jgi:hypothetical protein
VTKFVPSQFRLQRVVVPYAELSKVVVARVVQSKRWCFTFQAPTTHSDVCRNAMKRFELSMFPSSSPLIVAKGRSSCREAKTHLNSSKQTNRTGRSTMTRTTHALRKTLLRSHVPRPSVRCGRAGTHGTVASHTVKKKPALSLRCSF